MPELSRRRWNANALVLDFPATAATPPPELNELQRLSVQRSNGLTERVCQTRLLGLSLRLRLGRGGSASTQTAAALIQEPRRQNAAGGHLETHPSMSYLDLYFICLNIPKTERLPCFVLFFLEHHDCSNATCSQPTPPHPEWMGLLRMSRSCGCNDLEWCPSLLKR